MREILFRGKRVDNGEWVEGHFYTQVYHPDTIEEDWYWFIKPIGGKSWETFRVDPETVGQYTGLTDKTDKNGKKIFEGDILADNPDNTVLDIYEMAWFDCLAGFMLDDGTTAYNTIDFLENPESNKMLLEVIGNIHDNPELLGGC